MTNNYINVSVTSRQNQKVSVSTPPPSAEVTATTDTGKFWALTAERWATSNAIVENKDYSSKYYANQSKLSATNAKTYENAVKNTYNTFLEISDDSIIAVQNAKNEAVNNINGVKTEVVNEVNAVAQTGVQTVQNTVNEAKGQLTVEAQKQIKNIKATGFYMENDKLYFTNSKGEKEEFKSGGGGQEIGDIGIAPLGIDETQGKRRYLNGQLIIQDQYVQFTNKVKSAVALYPSLSCTESEWQTTATMTVGGQVGKFVVDDNAGTIRLPKIIMPIQGLTDLSKLAEIVEAGLPNISGSIIISDDDTPCVPGYNTGAFWLGESSSHIIPAAGTATRSVPTWFGIDASLSNPIYGNSNTVQQEQIQYPYFIQVATGAETEDNIINEIELNNPFSLLDYKYSEYELNNLSWLRSEGQWNSKAVHPAVYDLLLKIYNGTETKAGVSVKLSTETFTDYDFVLNTAEKTFRLPVKVKAIYFENIAPVVGNGKALGMTDGTSDFGMIHYTTSAVGATLSSKGYTVQNAGATTSDGVGSSGANGKFIGVTTDPTKSGIEAHLKENTNLYLYFYVGETVQNANLINAGRIEEKLVNLIPQNKELITNYNIPDYTAGVNIVSGFVAPNNGLIIFTLSCYTANTYAKGYINNILVAERTSTAGTYGTITQITIPVFCAKGDEITFTSSGGTNASASAMFYPLKGAN